MFKKTIVSILALSLLLAGCTNSSVPTQTDKPVIKIGYLPITHAAPLFLDVHTHDGEFGSYDVELVKFNSWPDLIDALNSGNIDGASVLMQLAMQAKDIGIDLKAVALGHQDGNVIISSHDIQEAKDLQGETFAIPHTHSAHNLLLNELLQLEDVAYDDVNIVEMPPPEMPAALAEDQIAGYVVAEPFGAMAVTLDVGKVLVHSDEIWPNSYCCVLVLRNDFIEENEALTYDFIESYNAAGDLANEKTSELYEALTAYMEVEKEVLDLSLEWISFDSLRIEEAEYEKLSDRILQLELMDKPPTYEEFIDNRFIDEANEDEAKND